MTPDPSRTRRILVYAQDRLHALGSKTANGLIMFRGAEVKVIVDRSKAGQTAQAVLGYGGSIPIVADIPSALAYDPDVLAVGIAPIGGAINPAWIPDLEMALSKGLEVWSGLHQFVQDVPKLRSYQDQIWDVRKPPADLRVAKGTWRERRSKVLLTIGSDANIGKMTSAMALQKQLKDLGLESVFIGTGQTGMMISGRGVAVDAVVSDFINGSIEAEIDKVDGQAPLIIVEGQGAVTHMGYSGVTLGLLHGTMPDAFLLAHQPSRHTDDYGQAIPDLPYVIDLHQMLVQNFTGARVLGVNLYSKDMDLDESRSACTTIESDVGIPVEDMVRDPSERVAKAVIRELFPEHRS